MAGVDEQRAAKRARVVEAPQAENPFDRLPDELVQRIFSELEATAAYEESQLWSLDRRFARLMRGVQWKELRVEPAAATGRAESFAQLLQRVGEEREAFRRRVRRVAARAQSQALAGCRSLVVRTAKTLVPMTSFRVGAKERMQASIDAVFDITEMLAALSTSPVPLENVCFAESWSNWPSNEDQQKMGVTPKSLEDVARAFQTALHPAPLRALKLDDFCMVSAFIAAAVPGLFPHLRKLYLEMTDASLPVESTSKLVQAWPRVATLLCRAKDGVALGELAKLPLEDLRVIVDGADGLEEGLKALHADSVLELCLPEQVVGPSVLASLLRFRCATLLSATVDSASSSFVERLNSLQSLTTLRLNLYVSGSSDGGAGLLGAAAAALGASSRLYILSILILNNAGHGLDVDIDPAALASFIRAVRLSTTSLTIDGGPAVVEVLREIGRPGPKLKEVAYNYSATENNGIDTLSAFSELRNLSNDRLDNFKMDLSIRLSDALEKEACAILRGWLKGRKLPISVTVNLESVDL